MKTKTKRTKIIIAFAILLIGIPVILFTIDEIKLASGRYTSASDIVTIYKVNHGHEYEILKTYEGTVDRSVNDTSCERNIEQGVIVKYDHSFREHLVKKLGCTEYDRLGGVGFYKTAKGRKFTMEMSTYSGGSFAIMPYAVERICGLTMDEIQTDSK